jgi:magnesium and cobalt transporter
MDPHPPQRHRTLLERLSALISREPDTRQELLELLERAHEHDLLDADALAMMHGALQVAELAARDIMVPRAQMDVVDITKAPDTWLDYVIETAHSRFPAVEGSKDKCIGILLAKDLLRLSRDDSLDVRDMLRPAVFIPESKRLNVLLRDFRANRNHMALVVNEHGGVAGLITIEDVLEQIVGDIEDEYDFDEAKDHVVATGPNVWRVDADTEIEQFNERFLTAFSDEDHDTIGGLVTANFGRVPKLGEYLDIDGLKFTVMRADARRIDVLRVERTPTLAGLGSATA